MFCRKCGKRILEDSRVCMYCGEIIKNPEVDQENLKIDRKSDEYYKMPTSLFWFWFWLILMIIFTIVSKGILFFSLIIPVFVLLQIKQIEYKYNEEELIIKTGLIVKIQRNIAMNKIEEVNTKFGVLNLIVQAKTISLDNIKNLEQEAERFIQVWNKNR